MPLKGIVAAIRERTIPHDKNWFGYKTSEEAPQRFLAERLGRELGLPFEPADIALTTGAFAAIMVAFRLVLDVGDEAVFSEPAWFCYEPLLLAADAVPRKVALTAPNFDLDLGAINAAISTNRMPIPDNWHSIGVRSSPYHLAGNRNAAHPVNAILNYAYAALETEIRIKVVSDGYDPTIGIMHEGNDGSSKFIFDLMEPERPKIDRAVLDFVKGQVFDPADFVIRTDGVCRLNPEMARMVVAKVSA